MSSFFLTSRKGAVVTGMLGSRVRDLVHLDASFLVLVKALPHSAQTVELRSGRYWLVAPTDSHFGRSKCSNMADGTPSSRAAELHR
jgi:hypothetical protein